MAYDVVINYNSTDYNFMVAQERDADGKPRGNKKYRVIDQPLMPETLVTGTSTPSTLSPDREVQIIQNDWRKGFQDVYYDDTRKFQDSVNCESRYKGKIMLSPQIGSTMSYPSYTTSAITDGGLEAWDDANTLTSWVEVETVVRNDAEERTGTYCARGGDAGGADTGSISQSLSWSTDYRGDVFVCQAYFKVSEANAATWGKLSITDGVNTVTSDAVYSTSWTPVIVSILIDAAATELTITASFSTAAASKYVYIDDITKLALEGGAFTTRAQFGDTIVFNSGKSLYKISSGALVWLATFPAAITDLCVYDERLFIAQGWSANYWYTSDLASFSYCTLTGATAKHMANVGGNQFWISQTSNTVTDSDDPISGGTAFATPAYTVGSADYDITGLVDNPEGTVYVRKQNMVYYLDADGVDYELIPELATTSTVIDYPLYMWQGRLYIPAGVNSLFEYDNGVVTTISPVKYAIGDSVYDGNINAICGDADYLYVNIKEGASDVAINLLSGRWETVANETNWFWHPVCFLATVLGTNGQSMIISSADIDKKLYANLYPIWVSPSYSDPTTETNFRCQAAGNFDTPFFTSTFPKDTKYWRSVDLSYKAVANTGIQIYKSTDGSSFTSIGNVNTNTAINTMTFDINSASTKMMLRFALTSANVSYTPIIYGLGGMGYGIKARVFGAHQRQIEAVLRIAAGIRQRNTNTKTTKTVSTDLGYLRTLYQTNDKMTITGPDSTTYNVIFARGGYEEQMIFDETGRLEEWEVTVRFLEI